MSDHANPIGVMCLGCGSSWDDARLTKERESRPELLSCCPERKMVDVFPASYVSDLEARLEKAEAERDAAQEAHLGAYEVCAVYAYCHADDRPRRDGMDYNDGYIDGCKGAAEAIRTLKSKS